MASVSSFNQKRMLALILLFVLVFSSLDWRVFAGGSVTATLKASADTVHSGTTYTLRVELSSACASDVKAEITGGKEALTVDIPAGQTEGSVEVKAGSYSKAKTESYALQKNGAFDVPDNAKANVKVLPKPAMTFNASFLMISAGRNLKVYFKCRNADQISVGLPISLRTKDGKILEKYTVDEKHSSFQHTVKIEKNWKFPYGLKVVNELTGAECASIPVMVSDVGKPGIRRVDTTEKKIALGFDCGYNNVYTDYIMDTLDEYDAKVTFFVTGFFCKGFPDQLKKIHERGHEIGNHTMNHLRMNELDAQKVYSEIQGVNDMVHDAIGIYPKIMRPPYGAASTSVIAISRMAGCETVYWTEDSYDWDPDKTADYIINRATKNMGEGCILLFHNSAPKTKQTLRKILDDYKSKGLKIVPVSELLYDGNYTVNAKGLQQPDPDLEQVTGEQLLGGRNFTVNVTGAPADQSELSLKPKFAEESIRRNKDDIARIKADPTLMQVSYEFGEQVSAPIKAGDTLGKATFSYDNEVWFTADMTAASDVVQVDQVSSEAKDIVSLTDDVSGSDTPFNEEGSNLPLVFGINLVILALVVAAYFTMKMINKKQSIHHPEEEK